MRTPPLLRNARHRAMVTPGSLCVMRIRVFHTSPSYWTIYRSYSRMETVNWIGIQMFYANPLLQKNIQSDMN